MQPSAGVNRGSAVAAAPSTVSSLTDWLPASQAHSLPRERSQASAPMPVMPETLTVPTREPSCGLMTWRSVESQQDR